MKVISFGRGGKRATAMAHYVLREDVHLETHDGRVLTTREQVAEEMGAWAEGFADRAESDDVVKVRLWLTPSQDPSKPVWQSETSTEAQGRDTPDLVAARREAERAELGWVVAASFAGHRYAFAMGEDQTGRLYADVVSLMASDNKVVKTVINEAGETIEKMYPERLRMVSGEKARQGRRALNEASEKLIYKRVREVTDIETSRIRMQVSLPGHGVSGAQHKLDQLIQKGAEVRTNTGARIANVADTAKLAKSWKRDMHSHGGRDVMHAVISARASENEDTFKEAVRAHLAIKFRDHKYVVGVHTDKSDNGRGHIHAHVLVAVKGENGVRFEPKKNDLSQWRQEWAEVAQKHGMRIVPTLAMTQANTQTYKDSDKAIIEVAEQPRLKRAEKDEAYARRQSHVVEQARRRVEAAQTNAVKLPVTQQQRAQAERSLEEWGALKVVEPFNSTVTASLTRLETSTQSYDRAQQEAQIEQLAARLDPQILARLAAAERQATVDRARRAQDVEMARQVEISRLEALLARLPIDSHAMRGEVAPSVMTVAEVVYNYALDSLKAPVATQEFGKIKTGELNEHGEPKMALSAAKMKTDLAQASEDITTLSTMLTGVDKLDFDQRATKMLNRMTALTKIQGFIEENNRDTITREEIFELAGPMASELIDDHEKANARRAKEKHEREAVEQQAREKAEEEAIATRVDARRLSETVQTIANNETRDPNSINRREAEQRVMHDAGRIAKDAGALTPEQRAEADFQRIMGDNTLTHAQKLDAIRKIDNPNTFDPVQHANQKPMTLTERVLEQVRLHPEWVEEARRNQSRDYEQER